MDGFKITTPSFKNEGSIPKKHSPQAEDVNPELNWTGAPAETKSFALIVDDPDAPVGLWSHWLVKNIPASTTKIKENSVPGEEVTNSWGIKKYKGPLPPSGTHRYFFKLYALKVEKINAKNMKDLYSEVEKNQIACATVMGTYKKH